MGKALIAVFATDGVTFLLGILVWWLLTTLGAPFEINDDRYPVIK